MSVQVPPLLGLAVQNLAVDVSMLPEHLLQELCIATEAVIRYRVYREEVWPALARLRRCIDRRLGSYGTTTNEIILPVISDPSGETRLDDLWLDRSVRALTDHVSKIHDDAMYTLRLDIEKERELLPRLRRNASGASDSETEVSLMEYEDDIDDSQDEMFGY